MTDKTANDIFAEQHNVASRAQLLTVLTRGVLCEKGEAAAALLRCPEGSCVTGPLGLSLLGVDGFHGMSQFHVLMPPEFRLPRGVDLRVLQLESPKEREVDPLLRRFDPVPEVQVYVTPSRRVDFFWRRFRLAIEYLGIRPHRNASGRRLDIVQGDELETVGVRSQVEHGQKGAYSRLSVMTADHQPRRRRGSGRNGCFGLWTARTLRTNHAHIRGHPGHSRAGSGTRRSRGVS